MPGLTGWGLATMIKDLVATHQLKALVTPGVPIGAAVPLAAASFSFAAAMYLCALQSGQSWLRARRKTDPVYLLEDRQKRYQALCQKIFNLENQFILNPEKQTEKMLAKLDDYKNVLIRMKHQEKIIAQVHFKTNPDSDEESLLGRSENISEYLLAKQAMKVTEKREDTIAWLNAGTGAVCAGLALLLPHAALGLAIAGALFYGVAATIKAHQLYQKKQKMKQRKAVYKALLLDEKNFEMSKSQKSDEIKSQLNKQLLKRHFGETFDYEKYLSKNDVGRIVDIECGKIYNEKVNSGVCKNKVGFFNRFSRKEAQRLIEKDVALHSFRLS